MGMLCIALAALHALPALALEQVVGVPLSGGQSISYLLTRKDGSKPTWILVMMPGSDGLLRLAEKPDSKISLREKNNFLIRTRGVIVDDRFATAIVDSPSDLPDGYSDAFRASRRHAQDIARIVADLKMRFPDAKLVLVGTSRGTISTALLGRELPDAWDAIVHTSTLSTPSRGQALPLAGFDYGAIHTRQLFVHHINDACFLCSFDAAKRIATGHDFITVRGGSASGNPCKALAHHGFHGQDGAVIAAIKAWISGATWPKGVK
jgi:hypothetical protein